MLRIFFIWVDKVDVSCKMINTPGEVSTITTLCDVQSLQPGLQCAALLKKCNCKRSLPKNKHNRATYTLSVYYYIVTDIYLKIISISYIYYISEYIVYIKNKNGGIIGK